MELAVISSYLSPDGFPRQEEHHVQTPFGTATVFVTQVEGREVVYIPRYGHELTVAAHRINYRANLYALKRLGVRQIISQNAIASTRPSLPPGTVVIPDDLLDLTKERAATMFDDNAVWVRVDMTEPFCASLRAALLAAGRESGVPLIHRGVFACVEGPRFETPAEVRMLTLLGADLIGTPLIPEATFARELEMCFASISPVINYAAGLGPAVVHSGLGSMVAFYYGGGAPGEDAGRSPGLHGVVERVILAALRRLPDQSACRCASAHDGAVKGTLPAWWTDLT